MENSYPEFWKLLKKAGLVEEINGENVMSFITGETVMAFIPSDEVILQEVSLLPDNPEELKEYLEYFFVSIDANKLGNYILPGIGEPDMYESVQISPNSTQYDIFHSKIGIYPNEEKFNVMLRNEKGREIETTPGAFPTFLTDALIYNIHTINFQSNN